MFEDLTTLTFSSATAGLGSVSIFSLIRSLQSTTTKARVSNSTAVLINVIAFIHYYRMRKIWDSNHKDIVSIRYSDWLLTCPLLLFEFFILLQWIQVDQDRIRLSIDKNLVLPIVASFIITISMLLFGYFSEKTNSTSRKWTYYILGFIHLVVLGTILISIEYKKQKEDDQYDKIHKFPWVFIGIWVLYGIAYLSKQRDLWYNILDIVAKGMFAIVIGYMVT